MMKKYLIPLIFTTVCLCLTIGYAAHLHRNYEAQKVAWNAIAQETFHEALLVEVNKRLEIPIYHFSSSRSGIFPVKRPLPDSVWIVSRYGSRWYKLDKKRFERQLMEGSSVNSTLSALIGNYLYSVDTLKHRWDSLLNQRIIASTSIRYVLTDLGEQNDTTYANRESFVLPIDSSLVSYIGYRCEAEFVGCVQYPSLWLACGLKEWTLLLLPWVLLVFVLSCYQRIHAAVQRKFIKREIVHVADAPIERAKIYQLPDGMLFDVMAHTIRKGNEAFRLSPQSVNLLKLLLRSPERKVTIEEIDQELWKGKASKGQKDAAISRLRSDLKKASSPFSLDYSNGTYQLKSPIPSKKTILVSNRK